MTSTLAWIGVQTVLLPSVEIVPVSPSLDYRKTYGPKSGVFKSCTCSSPLHAHHAPKSLLALFSCSTPNLSYYIPPLPFLSHSFPFFFLMSCPWILDNLCTWSDFEGARRFHFRCSPRTCSLCAGVCRLSPAAVAVFALAPLLLVLAETAITAVLARALYVLVFADAAAAAVCALALPLMVLAEAATTAVTGLIRAYALVLADTAAAAVFTGDLLPLVIADTFAAAFRACAPHALVFADGTATAVLARAP